MIIPTRISLEDWAASLIIDFPTDNIPNLSNIKEWRQWANQVSGCDSFQAANVPPANSSFKDWKSWAEAVFFLLQDN